MACSKTDLHEARQDRYTAERTASLGIEGLVYHGSFHGTTYRGIEGAALVHDSGWRYIEDYRVGSYLMHDETGVILCDGDTYGEPEEVLPAWATV